MLIHVVKKGELLWQIANYYRLPMLKIVEANSIPNPAYIYTGLRLYIPAPRHVIRQGETLWQIAQRYGVQLQTLMKVNNIENPSRIYPITAPLG